MLQNANSKNPENTLLKEITDHIHRAIHDLNVLSNNLSPSGIRHFGLKAGLEDYIANFQKQSGHEVLFICNNCDVEELSANDKISIFRIVQNFLLLTSRYQLWQGITVSLGYDAPKISLLLSNTDRQFEWPIFSEEFTDIQNRVEYYEGSLHQINNAEENTLQIELDMTKFNNKV